MKIINEPLLAEFRHTLCEFCGLRVNCTEAAHIYAKGHGGGLRLDHRLNLVALCGPCHRSQHDGNGPYRDDLIRCVAKREKMSADAVQAELWRLLRADRDGKEPKRAGQ